MAEESRTWTDAEVRQVAKAVVDETVKARRFTSAEIISFIGAVFAGLALLVSKWNGDKIGIVHQGQVAQVERYQALEAKLVGIESKAAVIKP